MWASLDSEAWSFFKLLDLDDGGDVEIEAWRGTGPAMTRRVQESVWYIVHRPDLNIGI